jgi:uncharacterized membrane protein SpoIIM required for sporulation
VKDSRQTRSWLLQRAPLWQQLGRTLPTLRRGRTTPAEALHALEGYRSLARDLATARQALPGSTVTRALEQLYATFHALVNRPARNTAASVLRMLREEIPATMHELRPALLWILLLFVLSAGAGWWLVATWPDLVTLVASPKMIADVENGRLWTDGLLHATPPSLLSARIFSNNIMVTLFAFSVGALYGLGTFYIIATNGLMLGAMFAFTRQFGVDERLLTFILAHGPVELSIIFIAGAAGTTLGQALMRPREGSRRDSFQRCVRQMVPLLVLCCALLIGCGLIEGYVSPNPTFPPLARVVVGLGWFVVMVAALNGHLWGRARARQAALRADAAP